MNETQPRRRRRRYRVHQIVSALAAAATVAVAAPAYAAVDPLQGQQWGLDLVQAPSAWNTGRGAGSTIAVVDSGVDLRHHDLVANLVPGRSLVGGSAQDDDGHGTHVSGIAAGVGENGLGISGVAPKAKLLPIKALTPDGGTVRDVADGIRLAADLGATVINLSLGPDVPLVFTTFDSTFTDAIRYAWSKGSICVLAAGNNSLPVSDYGDLPAIVVTAVDRQDRKAGYATSVGGARWGVAAPGGAGSGAERDDVLSTIWSPGEPNAYAHRAGTSMAAPFVSGAAAILRALGLTPQATVDRLLETAVDLGPSGRDRTFGSGRVDVARAVHGLRPAGPAPASPAPLRANTPPSTATPPTSSPEAAAGATSPARLAPQAPPDGPSPSSATSPPLLAAPSETTPRRVSSRPPSRARDNVPLALGAAALAGISLAATALVRSRLSAAARAG